MISPGQVGPLQWNTPIVDSDGKPTREFIQKWNAQARTNGNIPSLSTPAQVSAVLDVLSSARPSLLMRGVSEWGPLDAAAGSLLLRGAADWAGLVPPGDNTEYLSGGSTPAYKHVLDSDLSLSDILTNNASTTKHGFAPKLPNDATKYYDGTGAFSVPAGGGGGSAQLAFTPNVSGNDTTGAATQGLIVHPTASVVINKLWMPVQAPTSATYKAAILTLSADASGATITAVSIGTSVNSIPHLYWIELPFASPVTLASGSIYGIALSRTDGTSTSACQIGLGVSGAMALTPGPWWASSFFNLNQTVPAISQTLSGYSASGAKFGAGWAGTW